MDELEILFPDRELQIGGKTVTVREFTFLEGLRAGSIAQELFIDIGGLFAPGREAPALLDLLNVFGRHAGVVLQLLALATGEDEAFIQGLKDSDGQTLLMAFWGANQDFFATRLVLMRASLTPEAASA